MTAGQRVLSGRYRVDDLVGRGGMASVYRGYDLVLGREVAIKVLAPTLAEDETFRTRFRLEAQAASRMAHPSIVRVFDAGEDVEQTPTGERPVPYIVMELVHGTLLKQVASTGALPVPDAVRLVDGILEALEFSHRAGVVHRDIKPGNVMVVERSPTTKRTKVMDFGIARAVSDSSSTVAETTTILGTAAYFSPEQAKGEPIDARSDLYSTGVVLYELLTGRPPFRGDSPVAVAYQHVSEVPVPPSELNDAVSPALDAVVLRALAKDAFQRYPDAAAFRAALAAAADGRTDADDDLAALTNDLYGPDPRQAAETARSLRQLSTDASTKRTQQGPPVAWIWAGVAVLAVLLVSVLIWVLTIRPANDIPDGSTTVPDVVEMTFDRAQTALLESGLPTERIDAPDAALPAGTVIRTDPTSGVVLEEGTTVRVFVSTGVARAKVPELTGLTVDQATQALRNVGLAVGTVTPTNDPKLAANTVISASQLTGTSLPQGTAVDLVAASGRVTVGNVSGFTVTAATRQLEALGLVVQTEEDPTCEASSPRTVKTQSLAAGDVPIHSTVVLTSCSD